jgi:hypothetical protein
MSKVFTAVLTDPETSRAVALIFEVEGLQCKWFETEEAACEGLDDYFGSQPVEIRSATDSDVLRV